MTQRMNENLMKIVFFLVIFMALLFQSIFTNAQTTYKGFDVQFGTRAYTSTSDIGELHQLNIVQAGGRIGVVYGNQIVRANLGGGYYSSTGLIAGTIDQYEAGLRLNFYPMSMLTGNSHRVEPYLTGGIAFNNIKFFGHYINREPGNTNYSVGEAPFLGAVRQVNADFGAGLQLRLMENYDFVHLYSELRYGQNLSGSTRSVAFTNTNIEKQLQVSIGLSFGMRN